MVIAVLLALQKSREAHTTIWELVIGLQVSQKPSVAHLRCSRAHLVEPHAVTQCARAHIKYTAAYSAFMFYFLLALRSQSKVHKHLSSRQSRTSPEVRASAAPARLATLPNPARYVARAHERKRAPRLATPTYLVQCSFNCLCASLSLSLSLSLAPHPKRFRSTPPKKIRRLSRTARKREVARTWPTRRRRARARLLRTARAREVARTWPSYEMVRDTAQSFTRRYEMVRDTVTVH